MQYYENWIPVGKCAWNKYIKLQLPLSFSFFQKKIQDHGGSIIKIVAPERPGRVI